MGSKWYRLSLSILLSACVIWFWSTRIDELFYHTIGSSNLVDIGDARNFAKLEDSLKPNSYVKVTGILGNKAATLSGLRAGSLRFGRYQVRHLLGSKIYIEYNEERYHKMFSPFTSVEVSGRLASFGPNSALQKVRDFFKEYHHTDISPDAMLVVVDEKPRSQWRYGAIFLITLVLLASSYFFSLRNFRKKEEA